MSSEKTDKIRMAPLQNQKKTIGYLSIFSLLFLGATIYTKFNPLSAVMAQKEFWKFLLEDFFPPKFTQWDMLLDAVLQTFCMAVAATGISAVLALVLSFFGAASICPWKAVNSAVRGFASVLRNIPALVWAFVLVAAFGIGTAVGVLALVIATTGFLIRSFIETLEEVAGENMEALRSTRAGTLPVVMQSIIPAALPGFVAWFLYCIETNIRASTVLGMVGAGGIGLLMMGYIKQYNYQAASTVIIAIAVIVILVNLLTDYLRKLTLG